MNYKPQTRTSFYPDMKASGRMREQYIDFQSLPCDQFVQTFCHLIAREIRFRRLHHLDPSYLELKYEDKLFDKDGNIFPIRAAGYTERLFPIITILSEMREQARVLDVGCGCGSESLLMSLLGADVTGIDLISYRTNFAQSRISFYQSFSGKALQIQFAQANVFTYLPTTPTFNIIWLVEAISHVHPAEKFLQLAFNALPPNGFLILADSNALNPLSLFRSYRLRGLTAWYTYKESPNMETDRSVEVAEERIFSLFRLKKILEHVGFQIKAFNVAGFLGSYVIPRNMLSHPKLSTSLIAFQKIMKKTPILRRFGSNFTIVASKQQVHTIGQ